MAAAIPINYYVNHYDSTSEADESSTISSPSSQVDHDSSETETDYDESEGLLSLDNDSVRSRSIYVKIPTHPHLNTPFDVNPNDTIHKVKTQILTKLHFQPMFFYELMYDGKFLEGHEILKDCIAERRAVVYLIDLPRDAINVRFLTPKGKLNFQVKPLQTIGDAKTIIGGMLNTDAEDATMLLRGRDLDDLRTFHSYFINEDTVLEYVTPFEVFVELQVTGYKLKIELSPTDHVNELNHKVVHKMGLRPAPHAYFFGAKRLEVGLNICSYGVRQNSIIKMGSAGSF